MNSSLTRSAPLAEGPEEHFELSQAVANASGDVCCWGCFQNLYGFVF